MQTLENFLEPETRSYETLRKIPGYNENFRAYQLCYEVGKSDGRLEGIKESMYLTAGEQR